MNLDLIPNIKHLKSNNFFLLAGPCAIESEDINVGGMDTLNIYIGGFDLISKYAIGAGIIVLLIAPLLKKLMGNIH